MSVVRVPDVVGEIIAWRAWQIVGPAATPRLASVTARPPMHDAVWPTRRWFEAMCSSCKHEDVPGEGCSCGLYAAKTRDQLMTLGYASYGDFETRVIGEVGFVGKVIPGSQGWRAQYGRIVRLFVPFSIEWARAELLADAYRVPVEPAQWNDGKFTSMSDLAEQFGPKEES